jgi:protein-tyrosine-phosphatase
MPTDALSILFVCAGNTCRSVMAEAFARQRYKGSATVFSAGLRPGRLEDAQSAIDTLKSDFEIDASRHVPRDVKTMDLRSFTHVVAMDKTVARQLKKLTDREITAWEINDPFGNDALEYRQCALAIKRKVLTLPRLPESAS